MNDARLIAFVRPGYGLSDEYRYTEAGIRRTVVTALKDVLDALDMLRIDLIGRSMGSRTAILFALEHPDRVEHLTLVGSVVGFRGTRPPKPIHLLTAPVLNRVIHRLQKPSEAGASISLKSSVNERPSRTVPLHHGDSGQ